jgi:hypothetical protein
VSSSDDSILTVVAPFMYKHWLNEYSGIEYLGSRRKLKFVRSENILSHRHPKGDDKKKYSHIQIFQHVH